MAFGNGTKRKERDKREIAIQETLDRGGALSIEGPALYHVLADDAHSQLDAKGTSAIGRRLVRRLRHGLAAEVDSKSAADEMAPGDRHKIRFFGCGVRVYKSQLAFALSNERQLEIESLTVQGCVVVSFRNLTKRVAGLLRFDGDESDGYLLPNFLQAAVMQMATGDEVRLDVHGGAFTDGEAQPDTLARRNKILIALEAIVRREFAAQVGLTGFSDQAIRVDWAVERSFNFRIWTWDGDVTLAPCPPEQRRRA